MCYKILTDAFQNGSKELKSVHLKFGYKCTDNPMDMIKTVVHFELKKLLGKLPLII